MSKVLLFFIIWTLCTVTQCDEVAQAARPQKPASSTSSTPPASSSAFQFKKLPRPSYTQGEMADDEKVDPTKVRVLDIIVFTFLFAIGAPANFKIIKCLIWSSNSIKLYRKSRHHFLLFNLAIADAIVLFIVLPSEVLWRVTASWRAGNVGCKLFVFFRVFGLYASSMILICISLDRYYAVVQPFKYGPAANRISRLLKASWILSAIFSTPQLYFFRLQEHPRERNFIQCVTFDMFDKTWLEKLYAVCNVTVLYGLPLLVILICYIQICIKSFSRKNCKPSKKPSCLVSTNEPAGASSVIVQMREEEDVQDADEEMESISSGTRNQRNKGNEEEHTEQERADGASGERAEENSSESVEHVKTPSKDEVSSVRSLPVDGEEERVSLKTDKGQCILMKNLSNDKRLKSAKSSDKLLKVSTVTMEDQRAKSTVSPNEYMEEEKISEALVSGKCSNYEGGNYSASIITGKVPYKSRSKKQSEVRKSILRQTLIIILAFIICWTPYAIATLWWQFGDRAFYKERGELIDLFYLFAVSNSAVNPFIYGKFIKSKQQK